MQIEKEIFKNIELAFKGVTLDGGTSLNQTKAIDIYCEGISKEEYKKLSSTEVTDNYTQIPLSDIDSADCLAHLDKNGFKYYIPILMQRLIQNYDPDSMRVIGTLQALCPKKDNIEHYKDKYSLLNNSQKSAIAFFLHNLPSIIELDSEDKKIVERSFDNFWSKYIT